MESKQVPPGAPKQENGGIMSRIMKFGNDMDVQKYLGMKKEEDYDAAPIENMDEVDEVGQRIGDTYEGEEDKEEEDNKFIFAKGYLGGKKKGKKSRRKSKKAKKSRKMKKGVKKASRKMKRRSKSQRRRK